MKYIAAAILLACALVIMLVDSSSQSECLEKHSLDFCVTENP